MKLLLTSNGFSNKSISKALFELVGKKPKDTSLVFIPTGSNVEIGDKSWFIDDLINIKKQNFKSIAIADISAVPENIWKPQIEEADVLFFEGGNSDHLMKWVNQSGLDKLLPELLETKVYVGLSGGSMITGPDLRLRRIREIYGSDALEKIIPALNLVDFYILAHLNSSERYFLPRSEENLKRILKDRKEKTYALDDETALKVTDGKVQVVGNGKYLEFN